MIFSIILVLIVPFLCFTYFYSRTTYSLCCTATVLEPWESTGGVQLFIIYILTAICSFVLLVPYFVVNVVAGRGEVISAKIHFLCNMSYMSVSFLLALVYVSVHKLPAILQCIKMAVCVRSCDFLKQEAGGRGLYNVTQTQIQRDHSDGNEHSDNFFAVRMSEIQS